MDESVEKGVKLLSLNDAAIPKRRIAVVGYDTGLPQEKLDSDVYVPENSIKEKQYAAIPKIGDVGRITVVGYDTGLPQADVESALRKLYSSCGKMTDVYVPIKYERENTLRQCSFIYFVGQDAVDKALQLNGTDVGGWNVFATAYPFHPSSRDLVSVRVKGYDTSLSEIDITRAITGFFSSCGKVNSVLISKSSAVVSILGDNADEKAPELSGSVMGGRKLVVTRLSDPAITTVHRRTRFCYGRGRCYW